MVSKELLGAVLKTNVVEVYRHKKHGWKYKTHIQRAGGWVSNSDVPLPDIHKLAWETKKWAFDLGYFVETKALSSKLRSRESGSEIIDECFNTNWNNGKPYDPICDIKVCEWIVENDDTFSSET